MKSLAFPALTGRSASTRVTEADRVNASVDRHYRKCQRRSVIPMWVKQRRGTVVLNAVQRSNTVCHRLAVKAGKILINVRPREGRSPSDDATGRYKVTLSSDYDCVRKAAGIATDIFFQSIGIANSDEYEIQALHPDCYAVLREPEDYVPCMEGEGDVTRVSNTPFQMYA